MPSPAPSLHPPLTSSTPTSARKRARQEEEESDKMEVAKKEGVNTNENAHLHHRDEVEMATVAASPLKKRAGSSAGSRVCVSVGQLPSQNGPEPFLPTHPPADDKPLSQRRVEMEMDVIMHTAGEVVRGGRAGEGDESGESASLSRTHTETAEGSECGEMPMCLDER
eukprot:CAMPEP_0113898804 /NCGR_PEP_ID=MMETSP0780_2-20120614/19628_1 /TAXON_ID=652834 /ORGANISM="Palpitomonas bilix" /LENGTH=166 /DNA_ID=CAMNT_0000890799 /DNA_START=245 /DNA_END=745 /DNA_ORIENTATION=- /assembly_acc=CAM_ASM_000599